MLKSLIFAGALLAGQAFANTEVEQERELLNEIVETVSPYLQGENEVGTVALMGVEATAVALGGPAYRSAIRTKNEELLKLIKYSEKMGLTELVQENRAIRLYAVAVDKLSEIDSKILAIQEEIKALEYRKTQTKFWQRAERKSANTQISVLSHGNEGSLDELRLVRENVVNSVNHTRGEAIEALRAQKNLKTFSGKAASIRTLRVLAAGHLAWITAELAFFNAIDQDDAIMYGVALPNKIDSELGISEAVVETYNDIAEEFIEIKEDLLN